MFSGTALASEFRFTAKGDVYVVINVILEDNEVPSVEKGSQVGVGVVDNVGSQLGVVEKVDKMVDVVGKNVDSL